ncbi:hypothetical protein BDZ97DRAFT_167338 [Flammula alnicola]|nr:hypothetical protein BDZ97DRAFT_167338 [Flammula alnicola]
MTEAVAFLHMPRSPISTKVTRRSIRQKPQNTDNNNCNLSDDLKSDGDDVQEKLIKAVRYSLGQKSKKPTGRSGLFHSQQKALYLEARKNAKEFVKSSVNALEDVQAKLGDVQAQEIGFQKYYEDCHLPNIADKESFDNLSSLYPHMLKDLGHRRSLKLEGASTMLKDNAPRRQDALKEFSKNARQQLEQAKQQEKVRICGPSNQEKDVMNSVKIASQDAEEAAKLIEHFKNLLRA